MTKRVPEIIEIDRIGVNGADYEGQIPLRQLPRIGEVVTDVEGFYAHVELNLRREAGSRLMLSGQVSATVSIECQRCLDSFDYDLIGEVDLEIVRTMSDEQRQYDVFIADEDNNVALYELVEDELLLALPSVPKHQDLADCNQEMLGRATEHVPSEEDNRQADEKPNPFAILKNLKD